MTVIVCKTLRMQQNTMQFSFTEYSNQMCTCELKKENKWKKPGLTEACVDEEIQTRIYGKDRCYISLTCVRHMKGKRYYQCW